MKKIFLILLAFVLVLPSAKADEGMWLLQHIEKLNYEKMRDMGLKLTAEEIYSINQASITDAIMIFGGGCTGEIISPEGLLLTNHHCGYSTIQKHSTVENDYLEDGFWAMSRAEEIPSPGLSVKFVKKIVDVTKEVTKGVKKTRTEIQRDELIEKNTKKVIAKANKDLQEEYPGSYVSVSEFFGGNQFIMFVVQQFKDVRMVGVPPSSIGKFGGDTDNWMWPRHTGDFAMFRIYADANNNPADYSKDNVPYKAPKHLKISLKGVQENDFAMILGFPGRTQRYMTSYELDERMNIGNQTRIHVRGIRQDLMMEDMMADPKVKIQYANKYAGSSNYWKNSIGMNQALTRLDVKADKQKIEKSFSAWVKGAPERYVVYGDALPLIERAIHGRKEQAFALAYYGEVFRSMEIFSIANMISRMAKSDKFTVESATKYIESFYKNYNAPTDMKVTEAMIEIFKKSVPEQYQSSELNEMIKESGSIKKFVGEMFENSVFSSEQKALEAVKNLNKETLANDIAVKAATIFLDEYRKYGDEIKKYDEMFSKGHRLFIAGLMEKDPEMVYAPDANSTIRMTYGRVLPYSPKDGIEFNYVTTLKGVIEKEDPNNAYEFTVPAKLKELYNNKDYGQYAKEGEDVVTCFITDLDITGGNSGSPTLNANGELIGCAFDGNWEAMSGDIAFEHDMQRCIVVDIRYVLFIVDKFAGATHLIDEMDIVK